MPRVTRSEGHGLPKAACVELCTTLMPGNPLRHWPDVAPGKATGAAPGLLKNCSLPHRPLGKRAGRIPTFHQPAKFGTHLANRLVLHFVDAGPILAAATGVTRECFRSVCPEANVAESNS